MASHGATGEAGDEVLGHSRDQRGEEAEDLEIGVKQDPLDGDGGEAEVEPGEHPEPDRRPAQDRRRKGKEGKGAVDRQLARRLAQAHHRSSPVPGWLTKSTSSSDRSQTDLGADACREVYPISLDPGAPRG